MMFDNPFNQDYYPVISVPLTPYIKPGENSPVLGKRIRPEDSLNIPYTIEQLNGSIIRKFEINGSSWALVSVLSAYSNDFHVMLINIDEDYIPSPEYVLDDDGELLMIISSIIVNFIKNLGGSVFLGYNWSPRSFGEEEEKGGFQSIPTKWHPMFFNWDYVDSDLRWVNKDQLPLSFLKLNGDNSYGKDMGRAFKNFIDNLLLKDSLNDLSKKVIDYSIKFDSLGYTISFDVPLDDLLISENFFQGFLKPIAIYLNDFFKNLSEIFIDYDFDEMDKILEKTSYSTLNEDEIKKLRDLPKMKNQDRIRKKLLEIFTFDGANELIEIVQNRYKSKIPQDAWRKGFAYSLVFENIKDKSGSEYSEMTITPGVTVGSLGIVESKGIVLNRLENEVLDTDSLIAKSKILDNLANEFLKLIK